MPIGEGANGPPGSNSHACGMRAARLVLRVNR
jgi:hypothetical protein